VANALERVAADPALAAIHAGLLGAVLGIGPHEIEDGKGSYLVRNGRAFLGVHPRRGGLLVNIVLDRGIHSERMAKVEQVSRARFHNELLLTSPQEVDHELVRWVREAYSLTAV